MELLLLQLEAAISPLAEALTSRHFDRHPELASRVAPAGRPEAVEAARFLFSHLHQSLAASQPALFSEHAVWIHSILAARGLSDQYNKRTLELIPQILTELLSDEIAQWAQPTLNAAAQAIQDCFPASSHLDSSHPLAPISRNFLQALLAADRAAASHIISQALADGTSVEDIYLEIFQRTQREIGRLWQIQRITTAQEHYATAATQFIMSGVFRNALPRPLIPRTFVAACVPGELHDTGLRIVCDFFELAGWHSHFLGPDVPAADLLEFAVHHDAHLIGLSASLCTRLRQTRDTITHIRAHSPPDRFKIIVGGELTQKLDDPALSLNADAQAHCPRSALRSAAALFS